MTKGEMIKLLNSVPDDYEVRGWWEGIDCPVHKCTVIHKDKIILLDVDSEPQDDITYVETEVFRP